MSSALNAFIRAVRAHQVWLGLGAYIIGTALARQWLPHPGFGLWALPIVCLLLVSALIFFPGLTSALILVLALALGVAREESSLQLLDNGKELLGHVTEEPVRLVLRVDRAPEAYPEYTVLYGVVEQVESEGNWRRVNGRIRLAVGEGLGDVYRGDRLVALARLRAPRSFSNPGGFDYERHLARRGVAVMGYVKTRALIQKIQPPGRPYFLGLVDKARAAYLERLKTVGGDGGALLAALLAGDREGLPERVESAFESAGLSHLLAISGLHLGLLAGAVFFILDRGARRMPWLVNRTPAKKLAAGLTIPVVIAYALLTGMRLPTQRALIMVLCYLVAVALDREQETWNSLGLAGLIILLIWPEALFELSFILSFVCLIGLLYATPRVMAVVRGSKKVEDEELDRAVFMLGEERPSLFRKFLKYLGGLFMVSTIAYWSVLPLALLWFHSATPLGPLYNLIAVPVVGLILIPWGLIGSLLLLVFPPAGLFMLSVLGELGGLLTGFLVLSTDHFSTLLLLPEPSLAGVAAWYASGALLLEAAVRLRAGSWSFVLFSPDTRREKALKLFSPPKPPGKLRAPLAVAGLGLLLLAGFVFDLHRPRSPFTGEALVAAMIEVGQAQSMLVRTIDGRYLLIDGGGFYRSEWDVGKNIVAPCLLALGVRRLDAVVLTHPHPDHGRGLVYILDHFPVDEFWLSPCQNRLSAELTAIAEKRGIKMRTLDESSGSFWFGETLIEALHPEAEASGFCEDPNNQSLVLRLSSGRASILVTGDIEKAVEATLTEKYGRSGRLISRALIVPHHGSCTSSTPEFVAAVHPEIALISAAGPDISGLPCADTIATYDRLGIEILRTDRHGFCGVVFENGAVKTFTSK